MIRPPPTIAVVLLAACTQLPTRLDAPRVASSLAIEPYGLHQECLVMGPGERVEFRFLSSSPVAFNIHYREANVVIEPVTRDRATDEAGDFTADATRTYCLTWEAGAAGSSLDYRVRPLPPRQ
jgi:hypothetical protein